MIILSIDTSCDETACAVTQDTKILSNIIWSQASAHAKFGGVMPSLAKRMHEERIDWVTEKAVQNSGFEIQDLDAVAVTVGPGLSIALGVGVNKAKELAIKFHKPLLAMNHIEGHVLSPLANLDYLPKFPALGVVTSGGHTELILINKLGEYKILAQTADDALGEALDKAARMLGLGYPGGPVVEKLAKEGNAKIYPLPIPLIGQEKRRMFSYSGLKTSLYRKIESIKAAGVFTPQDIKDLAASFQEAAFTHFLRVTDFMIKEGDLEGVDNVLAGGGVMANGQLRKMLRNIGKKYDLKIWFPYTKKLYGDNAAMIGVAAYFKAQRGEFVDPEVVDRNPNLKI